MNFNDEKTSTMTTTNDIDDVDWTISKVCQVCGDKALAFNFNGLSCESCKAFFRRNAFREQDFICPRISGNCVINIVTRKYCRLCRLKKCFEIGMRKELTVEKRRKRSSTTCLTSKKLDKSPKNQNNSNNYQQKPIPVIKKQQKFTKTIKINVVDENNNDNDNNDENRSDNSPLTNESSSSSSLPFSSISSLFQKTTSKDKSMITEYIRCKNNIFNIHTMYEQTLLNEIINAGVNSFCKLPNCLIKMDTKVTTTTTTMTNTSTTDDFVTTTTAANNRSNLVKIYGLREHYVRQMIQFCKHINAFRNMKLDDQLAVVKSLYITDRVSRASFFYNPLIDGFVLQIKDNILQIMIIPYDVYQKLLGVQKMTSNHRRLLSTLNTAQQGDLVILDLIFMILMFKPYNTANISCPEFFVYHYNVYLRVLVRYLEHKHHNDRVLVSKSIETIMDCIEKIWHENHYLYWQNTLDLRHFEPVLALRVTNQNSYIMKNIDKSINKIINITNNNIDNITTTTKTYDDHHCHQEDPTKITIKREQF